MITKKYKLKTEPLNLYYSIKTSDGVVHSKAVRTRNVWNGLRGEFYSYDHYVIDVRDTYACPSCGCKELLWLSQFDKDNEYQINCDFCDIELKPTH
jgi:hypothetical protein